MSHIVSKPLHQEIIVMSYQRYYRCLIKILAFHCRNTLETWVIENIDPVVTHDIRK